MIIKDNGFVIHEVMEGVYHFQEPMRVCTTLLVGDRAALLVDTGYGLHGLPEQVRRLTALPLTVINTHGHHDHACGNMLFEQVYIAQADIPVCAFYTRPEQRARVLDQAAQGGKLPEGIDREAYLHAGCGPVVPLQQDTFDLGGLVAQVIPMPGHTPGSLGVYVASRKLLIVGDSWNPTTWLFFPEAMPVMQYADMMYGLAALPVDTVLASHAPGPVPGTRLKSAIAGLTRETFTSATPVTIGGYEHIQTYECRPEPHTNLVFDREKFA